MAKVLEIVKKVDKRVTLPNGTYKGVQGGYVIEIVYNKETYCIKTDDGVRGFNIPVVVTISNEQIDIINLKN